MDLQDRLDEATRNLQPEALFSEVELDRNGRGQCPFCPSDNDRAFSVFDLEECLWKCHACGRSGDPLRYVAEAEKIGGGAGGLEGQAFFEAWRALARRTGRKGPPEEGSPSDGQSGGSFDRAVASSGRSSSVHSEENGSFSGRRPENRQPSDSPPNRGGTASRPNGNGSNSFGNDSAGSNNAGSDSPGSNSFEGLFAGVSPAKLETSIAKLETSSKLETSRPEGKLRAVLQSYRKALKERDRPKAYLRGRGLSVETFLKAGGGFAPKGRWVGTGKGPRLVTPHTTPQGAPGPFRRRRLVNFEGRRIGSDRSGSRRRIDRLPGDTAVFNAKALEPVDWPKESGPLVLTEGPMDALSLLEVGFDRAVALFGTSGVPWKTLRFLQSDGRLPAVVFAFDQDETGVEKALEYSRRARRLGLRVFRLPTRKAQTAAVEGPYGGAEDLNGALQKSRQIVEDLKGQLRSL
jgi:hypothetical protein